MVHTLTHLPFKYLTKVDATKSQLCISSPKQNKKTFPLTQSRISIHNNNHEPIPIPNELIGAFVICNWNERKRNRKEKRFLI